MRHYVRTASVIRHSKWDASSEREFVSTFTPEKSCNHCADAITVVVPPTHWPVDSVAQVCYACGRVLRYADNLLLFTVREAVTAFQPRPWVVRRGSARQPSTQEAARAIIHMGVDAGVPPEEIAQLIDVREDYVRHVASHP